MENRRKYPKLESPCKECIYKCGRVEDIRFIKDEECKCAQSPIKQINEILGIQINMEDKKC